MFYGSIRKPRLPYWPLIGWDIFYFFSKTAQWNSTKLHRKQDRNVLYQVCVYLTDQKTKMNALASDWVRTFSTSSLQPLNAIQRPLTWSKILTSSIKCIFFSDRSENQDGRPIFASQGSEPLFSSRGEKRIETLASEDVAALASDLLRQLRLLSCNGWTEFNKLDRKQALNILYHSVFRVARKSKMAASASDWLRQFRLYLCNRERNLTKHDSKQECNTL